MESLGVLTFVFDLPQYVSTGNSITLQLTFKCFLFDRKFRTTLWDLSWRSTVQNGWAQNPELIYIISHHLFVQDCLHICTRSGRDKHLRVGFLGHAWLCANTHSIFLSAPPPQAGNVPPFESKVQHAAIHTCWNKSLVWQDIFLTLLLSCSSCLCVSLSPILTISQCCYWNVCVLVRTVKLMNDQPWQIHSPDPGAAGEETNGKLGLWRSQS